MWVSGAKSSFVVQVHSWMAKPFVWLMCSGLSLIIFFCFAIQLYGFFESQQGIHFTVIFYVLLFVLLLPLLLLQHSFLHLSFPPIHFQQSLNQLVELSSDWYWRQDENLVIQHMLYKGKKAFNSPKQRFESFVGQSLRDITTIQVLDKSMTWRDFIQLNESGKRYEGVTLQYVNGEGIRSVFEVSGMPVFGESKRLKGYHCISSDITHKWLTDRFVTLQRNFLQGVLLSTPISQLGKTYVQGFQHCLRSQVDLVLGYREPQSQTNEVFQSNLHFNFQGDFFNELWALPEDNLKAIESFGDNDLIRAGCVPLSYRQGQPNLMQYSVVWAVLKKGLGSNQPDYWVIIGQHQGSSPESSDVIKVITGLRLMGLCVERLAFEHQLQTLNQNLEARIQARTAELMASNQELKAFSYTVSHDLRAPLRAINGFSTILIEDYADQLSDHACDLLARITKNARFMGELIDGLLDFSRLLQTHLAKVEVDLDQLVKEVLSSVDAYNRIQVEFSNRLPVMRVDSVLIRQVWQNLIENAIKFSSKKEQPKLLISARAIAGGYQFTVEDNGAGFDQDYSEKLFQVFARLHHAKDFEGTGVGLAIVKRIIDKHGGVIYAESKLGEGAKFVFTLIDE